MAISMPGSSKLNAPLSLKSLKLPSRPTSGVPKSGAERLWTAAGAIGAFLLIVVGYFLLISPQRSDTASVRDQVGSAQTQNLALQSRITQLQAQLKQMPMFKAQLAQTQQALPTQAGVTEFLRSIQSIAAASGVTVSSTTFGQPVAITPVAPAAAAGASATPTPAPTAGAATAPAAASGVFSIAMTAEASGSATALNAFLVQLQQVQPRAVLITQLTESQGATGGEATSHDGAYSLSMSMVAFMQAPPAPAATPSAGQASP